MEITRSEKIKHLKKVSDILKLEFVGLDDIIDQIIQSITPWYVTPEIITRPVIISLWGMTGTGKTSIVRRLVKLLDQDSKTLFIDCGKESNSDGSSSSYDLAQQIDEFVGTGDGDIPETTKVIHDNIFVLDEFQYCRTLNEEGMEDNKSALRPVWSLLDSGIINYSEWQYGLSILKSFSNELTGFCQRFPGVTINECIISDPVALKEFVDEFGFFYYGRNPLKNKIPSSNSPYLCKRIENDETEDDDPYSPINIFDHTSGNTVGLIMRKYPTDLGGGKGFMDKAFKLTNLDEFANHLSKAVKYIQTPKEIDCSKSLVFVIGNLDEAFRVEEDVNPDMDADIFNDITSKVTIFDIKTSLQERFRAEQVARLGNNLIKYPTLRKKDFEKVITKELFRIFTEFQGIEGIKVEYGKDLVDLAYSEGVFPVQGVRPIFTTINTLFMPILSEIILCAGDKKKVKMEVVSEYPKSLGYRVPKVNIEIRDEEGIVLKSIPISLQLGALRYPSTRLRRYSSSVHEVGHAIVNSWLTGNIPTTIVSVSTDDGGFCETYDKKLDREIPNIEDIKNDVMISLAGYAAEELVFGDVNKDKLLLGSGSDLSNAWSSLSDAFYSNGFSRPMKFADPDVQMNDSGIPEGNNLDSKMINKELINLWDFLYNRAKEILVQEKNLLKNTALVLAEVGCIGGEEFKTMIETHGNKLTLEYLESKRDSEKWYLEMLKKF